MEVRAVSGDADRIAGLNAAGWRVGFRGLISDAYLAGYDGLPRLRRETLAEPCDDDIQLVADDGEEMLGWISGGSAHEDDLGPATYEVRACYVVPARWRTGIGRQLMAALVDRLDPQRWKHLVLWTVVMRPRPTRSTSRSGCCVTAERRCSTAVGRCRWSASLPISRGCGPRHRQQQSQDEGWANLPTANADLVLVGRSASGDGRCPGRTSCETPGATSTCDFGLRQYATHDLVNIAVGRSCSRPRSAARAR